jgi:hypothetical protein
MSLSSAAENNSPAPCAANAVSPPAPNGQLSSALYLSSLGWAVFPIHNPIPGGCSCRSTQCSRIGKHPRTTHGHMDATTAPQQIREWWAQWPNANIGVATGAGSKLVVIDVDPRHGGGETLAELERQRGPLPATVESLTGGGGRHLLFRHPGGLIKSGTNVLGPGIDVRGDGGYIVVPQSTHESGKNYEWDKKHHPSKIPLADLPAWILDRIANKRHATIDRNSTQADPLVVPVGQRHSYLTSIAGTMRCRGMCAIEIEGALLAISRGRGWDQAKDPVPDAEVQRIARDIGAKPVGIQRISGPPDPIRFESVQNLLMTPPPKPASLIGDGLVMPGGLGVIAGAPGLGKTWGVLDLLLSAAAGKPWLGVETLPVKLCRAAYVGLELPPYLVCERLSKVRDLRQSLDQSFLPDLASAHVLSYAPRNLMNLSSQGGRDFLKKSVEGLHLDLVIIDPLSRVHNADENDAKEMGQVLAALDDIRGATGAALVLVHHTRKSPPGKRGAEDLHSVRGSGRIISDAQTVLLMTRRRGQLVLQIVKCNCGPAIDEIWLTANSSGCLLRVEPPISLPAGRSTNLAWVLQAAQQAGSKGFTISDLTKLSGAPAVRRDTLKRYCETLADRGDLGWNKKPGRGSRWSFRQAQIGNEG